MEKRPRGPGRMSSRPLQTILDHLRTAFGGDRPAVPDGELLRRFAAGEQAAFTALVERHGPMVLALCRRVLGHAHDAEDAFQAGFLVLARKARGLDRSGPLGNWLYTVACRVALRARAVSARRRRVEEARAMSPTAAPGCD